MQTAPGRQQTVWHFTGWSAGQEQSPVVTSWQVFPAPQQMFGPHGTGAAGSLQPATHCPLMHSEPALQQFAPQATPPFGHPHCPFWQVVPPGQQLPGPHPTGSVGGQHVPFEQSCPGSQKPVPQARPCGPERGPASGSLKTQVTPPAPSEAQVSWALQQTPPLLQARGWSASQAGETGGSVQVPFTQLAPAEQQDVPQGIGAAAGQSAECDVATTPQHAFPQGTVAPEHEATTAVCWQIRPAITLLPVGQAHEGFPAGQQ